MLVRELIEVPLCRVLMVLLVYGGVTSCAGTIAVPVSDRTAKETRKQSTKPNQHVVREGDTLFSIAWSVGSDYRALARANGIAPPYVIKPGQRISLIPSKPGSGSAGSGSVTGAQSGSSSFTVTSRKPAKNAVTAASKIVWNWPTQGKLARRFSAARGSKGIDISGVIGGRVETAAKGRVVYAGSGLRGYGKLIIVKHNETYLSAYAHNRKLLVKEGDIVQMGQQIAEMGNTGTNKVKLHFQIRKRGIPVDPLRYLPKHK